MITFIIALLVLVGGYFLYGSYVERVFGPDKIRKTPALTMADGVDFIPLPTWKIFMIQFLNIAGLGPIFGAIMGAKFGTASYLWIVLGTIFAGAVHDYLSGMLSIRHDGESLPEIIGRYLGLPTKQLMRGFTVVLMILVGAVFVAGPAGLLAKLTPEYMDVTFWIIVVFVYYMLATLLPVDKIIGKIYPLFVIDGVIRDKEAFDNLEPYEIDQMSFLKDAASASIYGSAAGNGVVLVTTKGGVKNQKPVFNYQGSYAFSKPTQELFADRWTAIDDLDYQNAVARFQGTKEPNGEAEYAYFRDNNINYNVNDYIWQNPWNTKHSLSVTGGSEKVQYYVMGSFLAEEGSYVSL